MSEGASTETVRPGIAVASAFGAVGAYEHRGRLQVGSAYGDRSAIGWLRWLGRLANALVAPLSRRVRRGEGGLFLVNAALAAKWHGFREGLALTALSLACLLALYLFNDVIDADEDQHNPKKDRSLAALYARNRRGFLALWWVMSGLVVGAAACLDARAAAAAFAVTLINVAYSLFCKRIPFWDVIWVGVWGGVYASMVTSATAWIVMVGAMTAVCQIYQTCEDRTADARSGVATSATLAASVLSSVQAGLVGVLMVTAWIAAQSPAAATFAGLFAYWLIWRDRPRIAWVLAKAHFAVLCAYLLLRVSSG